MRHRTNEARAKGTRSLCLARRNKGSAQIIDIKVPTCWQQLSDKQLRFVFKLLNGNSRESREKKGRFLSFFRGASENACTNFSLPQVKALCLLKFASSENKDKSSWLCRVVKKFCGAKHIHHLSKVEEINVFYWFTSVKRYFANMFTHFFSTSEDELGEKSMSFSQLQDNMNTQIRALTGGDITKEKEVLDMDCWRALTELNAIDVKLKNRSLFKDGYWNTLCLPFSLTSLDGTPLSGATLMELDTKGTYDGRQTGFDASTGTLYLYFKSAESIEAGKPYIIKWGTPNPSAAEDAIFNPTFNGVNVTTYAPSAVSSTDGAVSFTGIYAPVSFGEKGRSSLFMGESNTIYYFGPNAYLNAFRAYFRLADDLYAADVSEGNEVKAFVLNFGGDDEVTGIESIEDLNIYDLRFDADGWYDLAGRRLNGKPSIPGIYINNGNKIIIK